MYSRYIRDTGLGMEPSVGINLRGEEDGCGFFEYLKKKWNDWFDDDPDPNAPSIPVNETPTMGRVTKVIDTKTEEWPLLGYKRPILTPGELYVDDEFTQKIAMKDYSIETRGRRTEVILEWKRPKDFCENPRLFVNSTSRSDIVQRGFGTCWFLAALAAVADRPDLIKELIPEQDIQLKGDKHDGVFHCRFYFNGEWHDVYTDDYLPVYNGRPWGVSSSHPEEMWVALVEKAFAKFHGGYANVEGGFADKGFITLTGGVAEGVMWQDEGPDGMFDRVRLCLAGGGVVACSVPKDSRNESVNLEGGHAYTAVGAARFEMHGELVNLLKIRNPWGTPTWSGEWSTNDKVWGIVPAKIRDALGIDNMRGGEFWIEMDDFYQYFWRTYYCNFTPDFDRDGDADNLNKVLTILGDWKKQSIFRRTGVANYKITVPKDAETSSNGLTPVALQLAQIRENRDDWNYVSMRADLYQLTPDGKPGKVITKARNYLGVPSMVYRYNLKPGDNYQVNLHGQGETGYIARLFSKTMLNASVIQRSED